jgi:predicted GNAT family acetyltransferase
LAERLERAGRYLTDVSPFSAVADARDPSSWSDLARLVGAGKAFLFAPSVEVGEGWKREHAIPCLQMVAGDTPEPSRRLDLVALGPADIPEMTALVEETRPGPFLPRTVEMGRYLGHRVDGRLVAMAGERIRCPGYTEVSAVCTHPEHRGRGLGRELTLAVVANIRSRGEEAFLHVVTENATAIRLYEAIGFRVRCEAEVAIVGGPS